MDPREAETSGETDIRIRFLLATINGRFVKPKSNPKTGRWMIPLAENTLELAPHIDLGTGVRDLLLSTVSPGDRITYEITTLRDYFEFEDTSQGKAGDEKATSWHEPLYHPLSAKPSSQEPQQTSEELREEAQSQE